MPLLLVEQQFRPTSANVTRVIICLAISFRRTRQLSFSSYPNSMVSGIPAIAEAISVPRINFEKISFARSRSARSCKLAVGFARALQRMFPIVTVIGACDAVACVATKHRRFRPTSRNNQCRKEKRLANFPCYALGQNRWLR